MIKLPPYYPNDSVLLKDWATYLDTVRITDWHVGKIMERFKKEGIHENTMIIFFTDHGISHARGKKLLYDEGYLHSNCDQKTGHPERKKRHDLVEHKDIAALSQAMAGIKIQKMEGQDILAKQHQPKKFVSAARDRCGQAADQIRSVRTENFSSLKTSFHKYLN